MSVLFGCNARDGDFASRDEDLRTRLRPRQHATVAHPGRLGVSSPHMERLESLRLLLEASSDRLNPSPERVRRLFEGTHRIAVVGLSRDPLKVARRVPSYLAAKGYDIIPVNPFADRILGKRAYATLEDVEERVDLVLVFRPSAQAAGIVEAAAGRAERPGIWLQEGIRADEEAAAIRADGRTVVQDLCAYKVHRALFT
jgi:predicted CoA-binding protein